MNPHYKDPVIIFGLAAPVLLVVLALGLGAHFRGKFEETYASRKTQYENNKTVEEEGQVLAQMIRTQEPHMNRWMALFEEPPATAVNGFFRDFQARHDSQHIQLIGFRPTPAAGGIGGVSQQPSIQLHLSFRGTFRTLQSAFLELETKMPQLQLDSIKLSTQDGQKTLNAIVVYTAWQK